ncbi:MAG: MFS transporter [bacterium]|nr:MFS transporter [bacterium]
MSRFDRTFLTVWVGQLLSGLGSSLSGWALGFWVFAETGSTTQLALVIMAARVPALLVSPFAGALVDRWPRRTAMILSDAGAALGTLAIAILVATSSLEIWHLYAALGVSSAFGAFQFPAYSAATSLLVPKEHHGRAAGLVQLAGSAGTVLGPFLGAAVLVRTGLATVFVVDLASFAIAVATLLVVRFPEPEREPTIGRGAAGLIAEARLGLDYVLDRRGLLALLLTFSAVNLAITFHSILVFPLLLGFTTETAAGATISVGALGMVVGSAVMSVWGGPSRRVRGVMIALAIAGAGLMIAGSRPSSVVVALGVFVVLVAVPIAAGTSQALWQSKIPPELQGRVFSLRLMMAMAATPLAYVLAGPLADRVFEPLLDPAGGLAGSLGSIIGTGPGRGIGALFIVLGLSIVAIVITAIRNPRLRNLETEIPDAIPDPVPA